MALSRRRDRTVDYWPGFVDALSTLLLAIMFLLSVFVLAQFILSREIEGQDTAINRLNSQIEELTRLLALEEAEGQDATDEIATLRASLADAEGQRAALQGIIDTTIDEDANSTAAIAELNEELEGEQARASRALDQVAILNQQILALRQQIAALEDALEASEESERESSTRIADLGRRLNVALARRVQELNQYRSDFFGRLRAILSDRENIRIVGDRFVFQSEVLFASGSADIQAAGTDELQTIADAVNDLVEDIPPEINWVLRVDGHTDNIPVLGTGAFRDNWELSAERAISVVKYLISRGVPASRLVAAGFGENQPLVAEDTPEARAANRRIELKLTER